MPGFHHPLRVAAIAVVLAALGGMGCSSKSDAPAPTTTASPAPGTSPATSSATAAPATAPPGTAGTSATSAPSTAPTTQQATSTTGVPSTPEDYARGLYEAWRRGDKNTADTLGTPDAVNALFAYEPTDFTFQDCQGAAGSTICTFTAGVGAIEMRVRNATGGEPVVVVEVTVTAP